MDTANPLPNATEKGVAGGAGSSGGWWIWVRGFRRPLSVLNEVYGKGVFVA